jgi:hypothetical protein
MCNKMAEDICHTLNTFYGNLGEINIFVNYKKIIE